MSRLKAFLSLLFAFWQIIVLFWNTQILNLTETKLRPTNGGLKRAVKNVFEDPRCEGDACVL